MKNFSFFCIKVENISILVMVIKMVNKKYEKVVERHKPKEQRTTHALIAFLVGGFVGILGELLIQGFCHKFHISRSEAAVFMMITLIFIASLCTALGFFDNLVNFARCGLLIPITGFAHSMTSAAIDYRKEGPIYGLGSNIFKLAGSVILYGVVSAWFFGMIRLLIGGGA